MKKTVRIISLFLCLVLLTAALASCGTRTMLSLGEKTLSVNVYEFLLSRMKGTLAYYGYEVGKDSFWNTVIDMNGTTYDDYFCETIKAQAINYIVADKLFDEEGLTLSAEDTAKIDKLLSEYVNKAGTKSALNAELKEYGVNYEILCEIYVLEAKIELLKEHLYGKGGENIELGEKEKYFNENYVAFKQIFIATYDYVIDEDRFGDVVYYTDEKHKAIAYDKVNGKTKTDEFGKTVKDVLGDPEYFTEDGKIAYDKKNGVVGYLMDENGDRVVVELDDEKKGELFKKAEQYAKDCDGKVATFEEYVEKYDESENDGLIYLCSSAGYYAAQNDAVAYFDAIAKKLDGMEIGECEIYQSSYGYHVLCKYENESGAYDDEKNKDVFASFYDDLISRLFEGFCAKRTADVVIDKDVFAEAPTMKSVGVNVMY